MSATLPAPGPAYPDLASGFGLILDLLRRTAAAKLVRNRAATPTLLLLWSHLHRLAACFTSLLARTHIRIPSAPRPTRTPSAPQNPRRRLPEGFGWLTKLVPETRVCGSQLQHLLSQPQMIALLDADPRFARLLRPLCRMLDIPPPQSKAAPPKNPAVRSDDRQHSPDAVPLGWPPPPTDFATQT